MQKSSALFSRMIMLSCAYPMRVSVINARLGLGDGGTGAHDKAGRVSVPRMRAPYKCDPLR